MTDLALRRQHLVDRVALVGIAITCAAAIGFLALDPAQTVSRAVPDAPVVTARPPAPAPPPAPSAPRTLLLPSPSWSVESDGRWAAFTRPGTDTANEIVVRSLRGEDWRVAYRPRPGSHVGQLALADGLLAFEEIAVRDGAIAEVVVYALRVDSGERQVVDRFAPQPPAAGMSGGFISAVPRTDGRRVLWARQTRLGAFGARDELRLLEPGGQSRLVHQPDNPILALALWRDRVALTLVAPEGLRSYELDLATGLAGEVTGLGGVVQSVGPRGIVLTGSESTLAAPATWLVSPDGTRTRLGDDCVNAVFTERVAATRCGSRIQVKDLRTGLGLVRLSPNAGALSVSDRAVVWTEGFEVMVYDLPPPDETLPS